MVQRANGTKLEVWKSLNYTVDSTILSSVFELN